MDQYMEMRSILKDTDEEYISEPVSVLVNEWVNEGKGDFCI